VRWKVVDLCQWICEEFHVIVAKQTLSRKLRAVGYRKLSDPRHHAQVETLKSLSRAPGRDRARKRRRFRRHRNLVRRRGAHRAENKISRRWTKRERGPARRKTSEQPPPTSSALCPRDGKGAALVMPRCDTEAMTCTWPKSRGRSRRALTRRCSSIKPAGISRRAPPSRPTSPSFRSPQMPELNPQENV
jgi:hypothetical protein